MALGCDSVTRLANHQCYQLHHYCVRSFREFCHRCLFQLACLHRFSGQPPVGYPPYHYGNSQGLQSHPAFNTNTTGIHVEVARIIVADPMAITLILLLALIYTRQVQPVFSLATALSGLPRGKTNLRKKPMVLSSNLSTLGGSCSF